VQRIIKCQNNRKTIEELRELKLEHEDNWRKQIQMNQFE